MTTIRIMRVRLYSTDPNIVVTSCRPGITVAYALNEQACVLGSVMTKLLLRVDRKAVEG